MVPKRFGIGWTLNTGRPASWLIVAELVAHLRGQSGSNNDKGNSRAAATLSRPLYRIPSRSLAVFENRRPFALLSGCDYHFPLKNADGVQGRGRGSSSRPCHFVGEWVSVVNR